jgi:predicted RNA-binding protein associated with RNAse of E/G family
MDINELKKILEENQLSPEHLARANELLEGAGGGDLSEEAQTELSEILRLEIVDRQQALHALDLADEVITAVVADVVKE